MPISSSGPLAQLPFLHAMPLNTNDEAGVACERRGSPLISSVEPSRSLDKSGVNQNVLVGELNESAGRRIAPVAVADHADVDGGRSL
jgi:hypothetical protein